MNRNLLKYGQYKNDIFNKLNFEFESGKMILDIGCGDGSDMEILMKEYGLQAHGIDIYAHENIANISAKFQKGSVLDIPYPLESFDYVFAHDVLHHVDEENQAYENHTDSIKEMQRVCKKGGYIIIVEGNRYNPLFYPHMVKKLKHEHWKQSYFKKVVNDSLSEGFSVNYDHFEAHNYPWLLKLWKVYEWMMERLSPKMFLAYNVAIIKREA